MFGIFLKMYSVTKFGSLLPEQLPTLLAKK